MMTPDLASLCGLGLLLGVSCTLVAPVQSMQCPPCERIHCFPKRASKLSCPGGVTRGVCGCCPACAKLEGELCGGDYGYMGNCDKGLVCDVNRPLPTLLYANHAAPVGICNKGAARQQADAAVTRRCRPACSPQFCRAHPRAICSARQTAEEVRDCQAQCQHTSCSTCSFVSRPTCKACKRDDFRCMKRYGKCLKRHTCSKAKVVCRKRRLKVKPPARGKFVCKVPECPE